MSKDKQGFWEILSWSALIKWSACTNFHGIRILLRNRAVKESNNRNGCEKNGQCLSCYVSEFEGSGNTTYINLMPFCGIAVSFRCSFNLSQRMDNEGNLIFLFWVSSSDFWCAYSLFHILKISKVRIPWIHQWVSIFIWSVFHFKDTDIKGTSKECKEVKQNSKNTMTLV